MCRASLGSSCDGPHQCSACTARLPQALALSAFLLPETQVTMQGEVACASPGCAELPWSDQAGRQVRARRRDQAKGV